ncbi:MAG TPA: hypothetical protein VHG08_20345 [Longimicrobium sp.]|nr:hypothetical protein [Longimicrobium sp.]
MEDGRPFILLGTAQARWRWTHGYVDDVGAAVALAATDRRAAGQIYNLGEPRTPTVAERVRALARAVEWRGDVLTVPDADLPAGMRSDVDHRVDIALDTRKIRRELGYAEPVAYDEALRRTAEWLRAADVRPAEEPPDYAAEDAVAAANPDASPPRASQGDGKASSPDRSGGTIREAEPGG